jgi:hypothetical protein
MSSLSATDTLISQILTILCQNNSVWDRCCCPDPATGVPQDTLLTELETTYPASAWTATLLSSVLVIARRIGVVKQVAGSWFVFTNFLAVNPSNIRFASFCPNKICSVPCRVRCSPNACNPA